MTVSSLRPNGTTSNTRKRLPATGPPESRKRARGAQDRREMGGLDGYGVRGSHASGKDAPSTPSLNPSVRAPRRLPLLRRTSRPPRSRRTP
jgi:hypothetical protein